MRGIFTIKKKAKRHIALHVILENICHLLGAHGEREKKLMKNKISLESILMTVAFCSSRLYCTPRPVLCLAAQASWHSQTAKELLKGPWWGGWVSSAQINPRARCGGSSRGWCGGKGLWLSSCMGLWQQCPLRARVGSIPWQRPVAHEGSFRGGCAVSVSQLGNQYL